MHPEEVPVSRIVGSLQAAFGAAPPIAIVLGSGLGPIATRLRGAHAVSSESLGLPGSTVVGHAGSVVCGSLAGTRVAVLSGRVHLYEGHPAATVVRYVRAFHRWGVRALVLTCSAGAIGPYEVGDLVMLSDHINLQGDNPLIGLAWNPDNRFPDLAQAHHPRLMRLLQLAAEDRGEPLHTGVYAALTGPGYETPAEIRMLATLGADLVGMSTVPELLAAAEVGLPAVAIAVVSNLASGLGGGPLSHSEVTDVAGQAAVRLGELFEAVAGDLV